MPAYVLGTGLALGLALLLVVAILACGDASPLSFGGMCYDSVPNGTGAGGVRQFLTIPKDC